jgi:hypothetical protein
MALSLPPKSIIRCDVAMAESVHAQLTSVIAGHALAYTTYQFYEDLDTWLGPWGQRGYPIGYGKFYNIAFSFNQNLNADPNAREWVWKTTILLQEALRDYVVGRVRDCTLPGLTQAQLQQAAFDSHAQAYDQGGLAMLMLAAPELIPIITTIPYREFSPTSDNFSATIKQVFTTLGRVSPQMVGNSLAVLAGPAHTGILRRAAQQDQQRFMSEMALSSELDSINTAINRGELDYIPVLDLVIAKLSAREFPDQNYARAAREVIMAAIDRRKQVVQDTSRLLDRSPEVRRRVERFFPELRRPGGK